jgi:hypothetical protein
MQSKLYFVVTLAASVAILACGSGPSASNTSATAAGSQATAEQGDRVVEVIQAGQYTYVQVDRNGEALWAAAPQFEVEVGDRVVLPANMTPMNDWHSTTLDRTWDVVYFAARITKAGAPAAGPAKLPAGHVKIDAALDYGQIATPEGGKTVAELFAQKDALADKAVIVRGKVVKVTKNVMNRNWVHVRDGSGEAGTNDLTVTTSSLPAVGDTVVVRGNLHRGVDFGAGYVFDIIVEDGELTIE